MPLSDLYAPEPQSSTVLTFITTFPKRPPSPSSHKPHHAPISSRMIPPPTFSATLEQHQRSLRRIQAYITSTTQDTDARPRAQALYSLHAPGQLVYGTVVIFHGLSSTPEIMRPTLTYFFNAGYNVYAPPGAGHAFHASRLPCTLMRPHLGADEARAAILDDAVLRDYFDRITQLAAMQPPDRGEYSNIVKRLVERLEHSLNPKQFDDIMQALRLLSGTGYTPGLEAELVKYFESDHYRYESHPLERLGDVASLPGPVSVIGYSLGGLQAINLAARANFIDKLVVIAPFVGFFDQKDEAPSAVQLFALGSLDLFTLPFPISTVSSCHLTASAVAARFLYRHEITEPIRQNIPSFSILSELDDACDAEQTLKFCREKLASEKSVLFMYPKTTGLKHEIHPGIANHFSVSLLQEMFRFLTTEKVHLQNMLNREGDPELPKVDRDNLAINV